jgi:uncharacterized protein
LAVPFIRIVTGFGPHENLMMPPARTAAITAADVQLAAVPLPMMRVGCAVFTARAGLGTGTVSAPLRPAAAADGSETPNPASATAAIAAAFHRVVTITILGSDRAGVRQERIADMAGKRRIAVRRSSVHGRGVFALTDLAAGEHIAEYRGEVISWDEAQARYENESQDPGHTFLFDCGDGFVIDATRGGNSSRWINHGCEPNCDTVDDDGRILITALGPIATGDELLIDYQLEIEGRRTASMRAQYACACGAASCRGTMLAI